MVRFGIVLLVGLLFPSCVDNPRVENRALSASEAVEMAERFIRDNGYTNYTPPPWRTLVPESIEFLPPEEWREFREDTLHRRAYGYSRGGRRGTGWTVVFRHKRRGAPTETGRAVTMDLDGADIRIEHSDFFLSAVETKL